MLRGVCYLQASCVRSCVQLNKNWCPAESGTPGTNSSEHCQALRSAGSRHSTCRAGWSVDMGVLPSREGPEQEKRTNPQMAWKDRPESFTINPGRTLGTTLWVWVRVYVNGEEQGREFVRSWRKNWWNINYTHTKNCEFATQVCISGAQNGASLSDITISYWLRFWNRF